MKILIDELSGSDFNKSDFPILFSNELTDKVYGQIHCKKNGFKFAWQSTIVKPKVSKIDSNIYSIGIDQHFAIVDVNTSQIMLKLDLFYFFYDTRIYNNFIYVITELEIIRISQDTFKVHESYALPDFFEEIEFKEGRLLINCSGNKNIVLDNN